MPGLSATGPRRGLPVTEASIYIIYYILYYILYIIHNIYYILYYIYYYILYIISSQKLYIYIYIYILYIYIYIYIYTKVAREDKDFIYIGVRGSPERDILSLGAMGCGPG